MSPEALDCDVLGFSASDQNPQDSSGKDVGLTNCGAGTEDILAPGTDAVSSSTGPARPRALSASARAVSFGHKDQFVAGDRRIEVASFTVTHPDLNEDGVLYHWTADGDATGCARLAP